MGQPPDLQVQPLDDIQAALLRQYSACDISDALLKLQIPGAGFIADLIAYGPPPGSQTLSSAVTIAPVSTVLFAPKGQTLESGSSCSEDFPAPNIPRETHWVDLTEAGSFVVLKQPAGQSNAVCGGIMALRMKMRRVKGIIVAGRVRDLPELKSTGLPIWAFGTSTVGASGASIPWAAQVPVNVDGIVINPGDIAFHDPANGLVIIPRDMVDNVLELLPGLVAADARVKEDVLKGMPVYEAFKLHRA